MILSFNNDDHVFLANTQINELTIGMIAKKANTVDYTLGSEIVRSAEKNLLARATGIDRKNILALDQVHGDSFLVIDSYPAADQLIAGEADGFITSLPRLCTVIRTADCVPVFAFDREKRVLGAAHSGWKGTRLRIASSMVREMKRLYRSRYEDIFVYVLPSIGPESYEVGHDVADLFPADITERSGSLYLNLWKSIQDPLMQEGILPEHLFTSGVCTLQRNEEFFSHRCGDAGRNLNFSYFR